MVYHSLYSLKVRTDLLTYLQHSIVVCSCESATSLLVEALRALARNAREHGTHAHATLDVLGVRIAHFRHRALLLQPVAEPSAVDHTSQMNPQRPRGYHHRVLQNIPQELGPIRRRSRSLYRGRYSK